jgi:PAS domain S-box-containing protein
MALMTAVGFVCSGCALLVVSTPARQSHLSAMQTGSGSILSVLLLTIGVTTLGLYALNMMTPYGWGQVAYAMAVHTASGFVVLASGLFAAVWTRARSRADIQRGLPVLVGSMGVVVTLMVWQALLVQQQQTLGQATQAAALQVANEIRARLDVRLHALSRMGRRWEVAGRPTRELWEADVMSYLRDFSSMQAINWADASLRLQWVTPLAGNEAVLNMDISAGPGRLSQLRAQAERSVMLTPTFELRQGGRGFIAHVPLFPQGTFDGFINGVFRVQTFFDDVLADIVPDYGLAVFDGTTTLYHRPPFAAESATRDAHEMTVSLPGVTWRVRAWPGPRAVARHQSLLPSVLLGVGFTLAGVLALIVSLAQTARRRALEVTALNAELEQRVYDRTAALRASETRLRLSLQAARMGTWEWDCATNAVVWSPETEALCGLAPGTFSGTYDAVLACVHPEDRDRFRQTELTTQQQRQHDYEQEFRVVWPDGTIRWLLSKGHVDDDGHSWATQIRGALVDITDRKRIEEALAQHARELDRAHADLRQVAYVSAHDLQEPVRQIGIYTQRIAKRYHDTMEADMRESIAFVVEGTKRMQAQFTDLMHYLEMEEPGTGITTTDCDLLVRNALDALREPIATSGAIITHAPLPTIEANAQHLQLLFQELLDNAVKFRTSAPPQVHVWAEREAHAWRFAVRDNGIGIAPQSRHQLFGFFRKLQRRQDYPGTGMGLAICKKIVERHGGRIWLDSQLGGGTTVYFSIRENGRPEAGGRIKQESSMERTRNKEDTTSF